jgi:FAD/FMN-containing dehydrogenase
MVSKAVQLFTLQQTHFAIRSGGAMPVADAANIGPEGILISSTNLTSMSLSSDKSILSVGSGIRWPEVYDFLAPRNVIVNGIRIGNVGVVGFLLGGGIGFFSYEHGIAATGVQSFEVAIPPPPTARTDHHQSVSSHLAKSSPPTETRTLISSGPSAAVATPSQLLHPSSSTQYPPLWCNSEMLVLGPAIW